MKKIFYGLDAPVVVRNLFLGAICSLLAALFFHYFYLHYPTNKFLHILSWFGYFYFFSFFMPCMAMIVSSFWGKIKQAKWLIDSLALTGGEQILDVGCGRGLLLITAAKKLTTGKAVGVDIWNPGDLSKNGPLETQKNAILAGVVDKISLVTADVQQLPFAGETFDFILSSLVIHNIKSLEGRAQAFKEMVRVLKPKGKIIIQDMANIQEYAKFLEENGLREITLSSRSWFIFPPVRIITAIK
jgi:arsenite methyltransferase